MQAMNATPNNVPPTACKNICEIMNNLLEKQPQLVFASNSLVKASS
jgi:hypothetical protein